MLAGVVVDFTVTVFAVVRTTTGVAAGLCSQAREPAHHTPSQSPWTCATTSFCPELTRALMSLAYVVPAAPFGFHPGSLARGALSDGDWWTGTKFVPAPGTQSGDPGDAAAHPVTVCGLSR
jgi:hypothetical protein